MTGGPEGAGVLALLWPSVRSLLSFPRSRDRRSLWALLLLGSLGLAFWAGLLRASLWFFHRCTEVDLVGGLLVRKVLDLSFLVFLSVLLFSNVVTAFSAFFLADDLELLWSLPLPLDVLYHARLLQTTARSSWTVLVFGLPLYVAAGVALGAGAEYYVLVAVVLLPFLVVPAAVGVAIAMVLARAFPVRRTRDFLAVLAFVVFAVIYLVARVMEPERLLDPSGFRDMAAFVASLRTPASLWLPSTWASAVLSAALAGDCLAGWRHLAVLVTTAGAVVVGGTWGARALYPLAWSRSREGAGLAAGGAGDARARWRLAGGSGWLRRGIESGLAAGPGRAILVRDALLFFRDPFQWSQLLLVGALMAVYLINFRNLRGLDAGGILTPFGLFFLNLGLLGFVLAALAVRFVFPSVSLEGRAFWILRAAPVRLRLFLRAKAVGAAGWMAVFGGLLCILTNRVLGTAPYLAAASLASTLILSVGLAHLAVGLGAVLPRFDSDSAARVATGPGGLVCMGVAMAVILVFLLALGYPIHLLYRLEVRGVSPPSGQALALAVGLLATGIGSCLAAGRVAWAMGVRHLEKGAT